MSREIKFRAWYEKDKQMIDWFSLTQNAWNTFRGEQPLSLIFEILVARKDDFNVMQYTGLKDKNGVEIYERDIVHILGGEEHQGFRELNEIGVVTYGLSASFDVVNNEKVHYSFGYCPIEEIEIIGNIHENPELLNQPI